MAKNLSFSYSKMSLYRECPQKYKFRYIHKIPESPKYYFAFGNAMHKALEFLYKVKQPPFPQLQDVLNFFDADWRSSSFEEKGYASISKELEGYDEGRRILISYYQKHKDSFEIPLSVEFRQTLDIDNLSLISIIDRIDYLGNGRVNIVDYKTGKTVQREPDQLYMYQKAMEASPALKSIVEQKDGAKEVKVERLSFYHLPSLKVMEFEPAKQEEIDTFWTGVLKTADDIRSASFSPAPEESKCRWCDFKNICPVFTGVEYEQFQRANPMPKVEQAPVLEEDILAQKIDELGAMQDKAKELKKEIITIMRDKKYNQHFGKKFKASLEEKKSLEFTDKQTVVDTLRKHNLLTRTLVPTISTIAEVINDPQVSPEAKKELQPLAKQQAKTTLNIEPSGE